MVEARFPISIVTGTNERANERTRMKEPRSDSDVDVEWTGYVDRAGGADHQASERRGGGDE